MEEKTYKEAQSLEQSPLVTLFELDLRDYGQGVFRFCSQIDYQEPVRYDGVDYQPIPIEADGFAYRGEGTIPRPTLRLSTADISIRALIRQFNELIGVPMRRIRVFARHLDNGPDPDPTATLPVDQFVIDRKSGQDKNYIEFELTTEWEREDRQIPARQVLRNACTHTYRYWDSDLGDFRYEGVSCPYAGTDYFDRGGDSVSDPANDRCGKRLSDCRARFGDDPLPFRGFPGLNRRH